MALYSDLIGTVSQAAYYARLMARHLANDVPTNTWVGLANIGLSTTQYVSELLAQLRDLLAQTFRAFFLEEWAALMDEAATDADRQAIYDRIVVVARNMYGITAEPAQLQLARFTLECVTGSPPQTFAAGDIVGTIGSGMLWHATESASLQADERAVVLCRAASAGSVYNVPIGTPLELKTALVGVSVDNRAVGAATLLGLGNAGLYLNATTFGVTVQVVNLGPSQPLNVFGNLGTKVVTISLRTDGAGIALSTADEVRAYINAAPVLSLVPQLCLYAKNAGTGAGIMATTSPIPLAWDGGYIQSAGTDPENVLRLKRRCETRLDTLGGGGGGAAPTGAVGTEDALVYWGLQAPAGYAASPVKWVRVLSNNKLGTMSGGESTVILLGPAGAVSLTDVAAVARNYENPKKYWGGINVVTANLTTIFLVGLIHVRPASGKSLSEVSLAVSQALAKFLQTIGDEWSRNEAPIIYPSKIVAVLDSADPVAISRVELTGPISPVVLTWQEFPVFDITGINYTFG